MDQIFAAIGILLIAAFFLAIAGLYFRNVMKIVGAFQTQEYSIVLFSRIIGVFVPVWGVIMGLVK